MPFETIQDIRDQVGRERAEGKFLDLIDQGKFEDAIDLYNGTSSLTGNTGRLNLVGFEFGKPIVLPEFSPSPFRLETDGTSARLAGVAGGGAGGFGGISGGAGLPSGGGLANTVGALTTGAGLVGGALKIPGVQDFISNMLGGGSSGAGGAATIGLPTTSESPSLILPSGGGVSNILGASAAGAALPTLGASALAPGSALTNFTPSLGAGSLAPGSSLTGFTPNLTAPAVPVGSATLSGATSGGTELAGGLSGALPTLSQFLSIGGGIAGALLPGLMQDLDFQEPGFQAVLALPGRGTGEPRPYPVGSVLQALRSRSVTGNDNIEAGGLPSQDVGGIVLTGGGPGVGPAQRAQFAQDINRALDADLERIDRVLEGLSPDEREQVLQASVTLRPEFEPGIQRFGIDTQNAQVHNALSKVSAVPSAGQSGREDAARQFRQATIGPILTAIRQVTGQDPIPELRTRHEQDLLHDELIAIRHDTLGLPVAPGREAEIRGLLDLD